MTIIATGRLVLRPLEAGDAADLVSGLNNFNVARWTARVPYPYGLSDAETFLALCRTLPEGTLRAAMTLGGRLIGVISYERDAARDEAELGYWIAEDVWGQGYGREAARAMTDHAFEIAGHAELRASYHLGNEASRRILEGLGFEATGTGTGYSRAQDADVPLVFLKLSRDGWLKAKGRRR